MIDSRFPFHARVTGSKIKFLVVSTAPTDLVALPSLRYLVSDQARPSLIATLQATEGKVLVQQWKITETMLWRIKKGLGIATAYSGSSRTTQWRQTGEAPKPTPTSGVPTPSADSAEAEDLTIVVTGQGRRKIWIVSLPPPLEFELSIRANVLIEPKARDNFRFWLANNTIDQAAEILEVSRSIIHAARVMVGVKGWS